MTDEQTPSSVRPVGRAVIIMGVSGCGKSTVGKACAELMGWSFIDGDDFHSAENKQKMASGEPLTDADRVDWLNQLGKVLQEAQPERSLVMPCSALRKRYRDQLRAASPGLRFVFLELDHDEAVRRAVHRRGHFFSPTLVASQFDTLENPSGEDGVLTLDARLPVPDLARDIAAWLAPDSVAGRR